MKKCLKDHFIPHSGNDYKPHILQTAASLVMLVLIVISFTLANVQALLWVGSDWLVGAVLPAVIVDLTNVNRNDGSLTSLTRNSILDEAAKQKANHMASNQYFAHFAPDGTSPWFFFDQVGYNFINAGENLAINFSDSDDVVRAWMNSPTHQANIMNDRFTEIGIGVAKGTFNGTPTIYVVQFFGTPQTIVPVPVPSVVAEITTQPEVESAVAAAEISIEPSAPPVTPVSVRKKLAIADEKVTTSTAVVPNEVKTEEDNTLLFSDLATTTRPAIGTTNDFVPPSINKPVPTESSFIGRLATSPNTMLQLIYSALALFVVGALMLSIFIEVRRQHPVQIAYGTGLLGAMALLLYVHTVITGSVLIL